MIVVSLGSFMICFVGIYAYMEKQKEHPYSTEDLAHVTEITKVENLVS